MLYFGFKVVSIWLIIGFVSGLMLGFIRFVFGVYSALGWVLLELYVGFVWFLLWVSCWLLVWFYLRFILGPILVLFGFFGGSICNFYFGFDLVSVLLLVGF